ncbi:MAG: hypothetical protein WBD91_18805 [Acidobacteriaceae bacterium]|jgi:hypothetical protein
MNLLDRYLLAVKKYLPWKRQDDILAELRANLESQLEEKESDLGRPLTAEEMQEWLKRLGPPMMMAARYQPQQYLIGPTIFPIYGWVMRLALLWCLVIYSVVNAVAIIANSPSGRAVWDAVLHVPGVLIITAAWVTVVFAAIEYTMARSPEKFPASAVSHVDWPPSKLPTAEEVASEGKRPRSHASAVAEIVFGFLWLIWLLLIPSHPYLLMGPGAAYLRVSPYELAPVWALFFWCIVALNVVQLGWRLIDLARGTWQQSRALQHITVKTLGLIATLILFTAPDRAWVLLKHPVTDVARYGASVNSINHSIYEVLVWVVVVTAMIWLWQIGQVGLDFYRKRVAAKK